MEFYIDIAKFPENIEICEYKGIMPRISYLTYIKKENINELS